MIIHHSLLNHPSHSTLIRSGLAFRLAATLLVVCAMLLLLGGKPAFGGSRATGIHAVASGDSMRLIAAEHATTPEAVREANGLSADAPLAVGQILIVPGAETRAEDGTAAVERFYEWYSAEARGGSRPLLSGALMRSPFLTDAFKREIDERLVWASDLNWDPILCGQPAPESISVQAQWVDSPARRFTVVGTAGLHLTVTTRQENGEWQIEKISCPMD